MAEGHVQRRLAAILAADVVGYSRLMEADEAGTMAALKARRKEVLEPLVTKHQGRILKVTGDGVLVEFASAVNAIQCAVDLQHDMASANAGQPEDHHIVLRIGVNLGDVTVEGSDLYGEGVNIAARLESLAEPGGSVPSSLDCGSITMGRVPRVPSNRQSHCYPGLFPIRAVIFYGIGVSAEPRYPKTVYAARVIR
jgi:adenylate cyclase